jgi:hypothetical protein
VTAGAPPEAPVARVLPQVAAIGAVAAVLAAVAVAAPRTFHAWMQEDAWAEWATFAAFSLACVRWSMRARAVDAPTSLERALERAALASVALFCVFVAGEEISWAQRLLGFRPPDVFLEQNFQQELNVHNFLKGKEAAGFKLDSRYLVALIGIAYGGVVPLIARGIGAGPLARLFVVRPDPWLSPIFLGIAIVEITYPVPLTGEAAELVLGLAFLAAAGPASRRGLAWQGGAVAAGPALAVAVPLLLYGADEEAAAQEGPRPQAAVHGDAPARLRALPDARGLLPRRVAESVLAGVAQEDAGARHLLVRSEPQARPRPGRADALAPKRKSGRRRHRRHPAVSLGRC